MHEEMTPHPSTTHQETTAVNKVPTRAKALAAAMRQMELELTGKGENDAVRALRQQCGAWLAAQRVRCGLTQEHVAATIEANVESIVCIERGLGSPQSLEREQARDYAHAVAPGLYEPALLVVECALGWATTLSPEAEAMIAGEQLNAPAFQIAAPEVEAAIEEAATMAGATFLHAVEHPDALTAPVRPPSLPQPVVALPPHKEIPSYVIDILMTLLAGPRTPNGILDELDRSAGSVQPIGFVTIQAVLDQMGGAQVVDVRDTVYRLTLKGKRYVATAISYREQVAQRRPLAQEVLEVMQNFTAEFWRTKRGTQGI